MFSPPAYRDWLRLVEEELKAPAAEYAISADLEANPFVEHRDLQPVNIRKPGEGWIISQAAESAEDILGSLEGGAGGITLWADAGTVFPDLLKNVYLDFITLRLRVEDARPLLNLHDHAVNKGYDLSRLDIVVQGLPYAAFKTINERFGGHLSFEINVTEAGTSALKQLLVQGEKAVFTENIPKIVFSLPAQENFYLNLSTVRALRYLWQKIGEANFSFPDTASIDEARRQKIKEANPSSPEIAFADGARRQKIGKANSSTDIASADRALGQKIQEEHGKQGRIFVLAGSAQTDPNLQVIAYTQMIASSAIGGANWIESAPLPYPEPEYSRTFARRINRNIQHILQKESFLDRVDDAAAGSWFLDDLTRKIITQTWEKFLAEYE